MWNCAEDGSPVDGNHPGSAPPAARQSESGGGLPHSKCAIRGMMAPDARHPGSYSPSHTQACPGSFATKENGPTELHGNSRKEKGLDEKRNLPPSFPPRAKPEPLDLWRSVGFLYNIA